MSFTWRACLFHASGLCSFWQTVHTFCQSFPGGRSDNKHNFFNTQQGTRGLIPSRTPDYLTSSWGRQAQTNLCMNSSCTCTVLHQNWRLSVKPTLRSSLLKCVEEWLWRNSSCEATRSLAADTVFTSSATAVFEHDQSLKSLTSTRLVFSLFKTVSDDNS